VTGTVEAPAAGRGPAGHLEPGRPLDDAVAATLTTPGPWLRAAVAPIVAVVALGVLIPLVVVAADLPRHGDVAALYSLVGELLLGAVILIATRRVARSCGGWRAAIGLTPPVRGDGKRVLAWFGIQFGVRFGLALVLAVAAPDLRNAGNLAGVDDLGPAGIAMLIVAAGVVAPFVEEIAFRGVLLRALMRRVSYWPAAGISSLVFALLHAPTASSWAGAVAVVLFIYAFGLVQCQLVRRTARLAPAIGVHAVVNVLTITAALAAA
jgi:membrane protease YdiL (CAAX protease family)